MADYVGLVLVVALFALARYGRVVPKLDDPDRCFPSTTWVSKMVKVPRRPQGQQPRGPKGRRWFSLPTRNPRDPLTIKVSYRGGAECWYEVHARGSMGRYPGYVSLHDVMREINRS